MDNANALLDIYKDKNLPVTIWSGHNHIAETVTVPRSDMTVTEYTHPPFAAPGGISRFATTGRLRLSRVTISAAGR